MSLNSLHHYIFLFLWFPMKQICMLNTVIHAAQTQVLLVPGKKMYKSTFITKIPLNIFKQVSVY